MNSRIILVKNINIDRQYVNVLSYTEEQMLQLCLTNKITEANDYSFIRQNGTIQTKFSYEQCLQANYIAFQNKDYSNKWFFAWIDEVIYKGNYNTEIQFTIDAWSTWFDYWQKKPCFINRQHVNDDTIGIHTIPENLDVGQLISDFSKTEDIIGAESFYWFVIASNYNPSNQTRYAGVGLYGNYPQGSMWFAWLININNPTDEINSISDWVFEVTKQSQAGNITAMFALPYQAFSIGDIDTTSHLVENGKGKLLNKDLKYNRETIRTIENFKPKNNKLLVYPYSFLRITNNLGSVNDYKIEDFETDTEGNIIFNAIGLPCIGYSGKIRPVNYRGVKYNEDESIPLGKYPTLSWSSDGFTNWLTQNGINLGINGVKTAINAGLNIATGNIGKGIGSVASSIGETIGNFYSSSLGSNTAEGNANSGDIAFGANLIRFKIQHMRPKLEYLKIIDDYFTRFGYKINKIETPNIIGRKNWNYVEIASSEEIGIGTVPSKYMELINNACRKGVTIWHNHTNLGNYSLDNSIV